MEQVPFAIPGAVAVYSAKSAGFTAGVSDRGTFFDCTGPFTLALTAAATLGAGWSCWVRCVSGTITIDPNGAELINGAATYAVGNAGDVVLVECTGTAFQVAHTQRPSTVALTGGTIVGVTLSGCTSLASTFSGATIFASSITGSTITSGTILSATLSGCTSIGGTFSGSTIVASTLSGCTLLAASISGATILASSVSGATITGGTINSTPIGTGTAAAGTFTTLTDTGLTDTRITMATTGGLLTDSANLTYASGTLSNAGGDISASGKFLPNNSVNGFLNSSQAALYGTSTGAVVTFPFDANGNAVLEARGGASPRAVVLASAGGSFTAYLDSVGTFNIPSSTASTSTTTGALIVTGGIATSGNITFNGNSGSSLRVTNSVANAAVAVTFGAVGPTGSTAGNQQGWLRLSVAGTDRYIPFW